MTPELVVVNAAGIPCIPRDLFHRIVDGIQPVKEMEMLLFGKLSGFVVVIVYVMMLLGFFNEFSTSIKVLPETLDKKFFYFKSMPMAASVIFTFCVDQQILLVLTVILFLY